MSCKGTPDYLLQAAGEASALAHRLTRAPDQQSMHRTIVTAFCRSVNAQLGALALLSRDDNTLRIEATHGYPQSIVEHIRVRPDEGILGHVLATGRAVFIGADPPQIPLPHRRRYRTQSCIVVPLKTPTAVLGVAAVADPRHKEHFQHTDLRALRLFLPAAVLALDREQLRHDIAEVRQAAIVDPVTRLANRQYLNQRLEAELERTRRLKHSLAVMLIDIDDFKAVNDTWGHLEGDRLLREIASIIAEHVRIFDVCTRFGGEEFAILMPGAGRGVAVQVAERVRRAVEHAYRDFGAGVRVTLSAGVALLDDGDTTDALLRRADRALFRAKAAGKNSVQCG